jgi:mRNA interferase MazF
MGAFTTGSVVLIAFPFSDLSRTKLRPAVILAELDRDDYILCQITSQSYIDTRAIILDQKDWQIQWRSA